MAAVSLFTTYSIHRGQMRQNAAFHTALFKSFPKKKCLAMRSQRDHRYCFETGFFFLEVLLLDLY